MSRQPSHCLFVTAQVAIATLCLSSVVLANDYYIDPVRGKDVATGGTQAAPWRTIQYAIQQTYTTALAGNHTYHLAAGAYQETVHFNYPAAQGFTASFAGTANRSAVIDGGFTMHKRMRGLSVTGVTCKIIDYDTYDPSASASGSLTVTNCRVTQEIKHHSKGSGPPAPTDIRQCDVERIELSFCCDAGIRGEIADCLVGSGGIVQLGACQSYRIVRSYVRGPAVLSIFEASRLDLIDCVFAPGGIRLHVGSPAGTTVTVDDCTVSGVAGPGLAVDVVVAPGERATVIVRDSVIYRCAGGVVMQGDFGQLELDGAAILANAGPGVSVTGLRGTNVLLHHSVIADSTGIGASIQETSSGSTMHWIRIEDSILARNQRGIVVAGRSASSVAFQVTGCTVADNLQAGIQRPGIAAANARISHSILVGKSPLGSQPWPVDYCLSDTVTLPGSNNIKADPRFLGRSWGDYHLSPLSPAVDAGVVGTGGTDFEGDPRHIAIRTTTAHRDLGADELSLAGQARPFGASATSYGFPRLQLLAPQPFRIATTSTLEVQGPRPTDAVLWIADVKDGPVLELVPGVPIYIGTAPWIAVSQRKTTGAGYLPVVLPNDPGLVGAGAIVQAVAGNATGFAASRGLRIIVGK